MGTMPVPHTKAACPVAGLSPLFPSGRSFRTADVLRAGRNSPPAVKGLYSPEQRSKPASAFFPKHVARGKRVSRFGVTPKPTVKVRMKENGRDAGASCEARVFSFRVP